MKVTIPFICLGLFLGEVSLAHAATINLNVSSYARYFGASSDYSNLNFDSYLDGGVHSAFSTATLGTSIGTAYASVDSDSGKIRTRVTTDYEVMGPGTGPYNPAFPEAGAAAYGQIKESAVVSGNGTVRAEVKFDGNWDVNGHYSDLPLSIYYQVQGNLALSSALNGNAAIDQFNTYSGDTGLNSGSADGILSVFLNVVDGETLNLSFDWLSQIVQGRGIVDFSNTASLSIFASKGVSLAYGDQRFLSASSTAPSPVPLPAAGWMLAAALGGIGAMRRFRLS